ncbi:hypothetical protein H8959_007321 [Pygathrix nigripes]
MVFKVILTPGGLVQQAAGFMGWVCRKEDSLERWGQFHLGRVSTSSPLPQACGIQPPLHPHSKYLQQMPLWAFGQAFTPAAVNKPCPTRSARKAGPGSSELFLSSFP